jgi:two-component system response regulator NreC
LTGIRVLIADDHPVVRAGIRALIEQEPDLTVVGEVATGEEAVQEVARASPDLVLMDLAMPGIGGLEATRRIADIDAGTRVIILSVLPEAEHLLAVLEAGAGGFIPKTSSSEELVRAIRAVAGGQLYLRPDSAKLAVLQRYKRDAQTSDEVAALDRLSRREREVLAFIALGHSSSDIASRLSLSPKTVDTYRARLMDKLGLRRRPDLVRFALRTGIVKPE